MALKFHFLLPMTSSNDKKTLETSLNRLIMLLLIIITHFIELLVFFCKIKRRNCSLAE